MFKEELLKAGVSPAILEAATEASKSCSETLRITAAPQEVLAPLAQVDGTAFY